MKRKLDRNLIMELLKKKYKNGGELTSVAPSVLSILETSLSGIQEANQLSQNARNSIESNISQDFNPMYALGGDLTKFKGGKHSQGGVDIDSNMNQTSTNAVGNVEGEESGYKNKDGSYIYSDQLSDFKNPGNTFSDVAQQIGKKYKRTDDISKNTSNIEMEQLKDRNNATREMVESFENKGKDSFYKYGGKLKEYSLGDSFNTKFPLNPSNNLKFPNEEILKIDSPNLISQLPGGKYSLNNPVKGISGFINNSSFNNPSLQNPTYGKSLDNTSIELNDINYNNVAVGLKGLGLGKSFYDSIRGSEQENLQLNPAEDEVRNLMENQRIDLTSVRNEIGLGTNKAIRQSEKLSGSPITNQVLGQLAIQKGAKANSASVLQEQQLNNQYRAQEAAVKGQLGSEKRQEKIRQQTAQSQNDAVDRGFGRQFVSELTQIGTEFNKKSINDAKIQEGIAILGMKYKDFGVSEDIMERIKKGEYSFDDWIIFKNATDNAKTQ